VAGQWLALTPVCLEPLGFTLAFFSFRLFDILKTWPANRIETSLKGGLGIMTDDMIAGLYAAVVTTLFLQTLGFNSCFPSIF
jgi:phosphatidylglycerophosphatase A